MRGIAWGGLAAAACILALAPPAAAQGVTVSGCDLGGTLPALACEGGPYVSASASWDPQPADGYGLGGNATACTNPEPECWDGALHAGVTLAWGIHADPATQDAAHDEQPRVCVGVPFPAPVDVPVSGIPPGVWDRTGVMICYYDGEIHFNGCPPMGPTTVGPEPA